MSEDNKNIKQYSSADIQKYLQGKLSAAEMYAMEKAAMDDPFLADAIEGMQNNFEDETTFNNDIEDLKKRLAERIEEKNKIIPISPNRLWWRVAATVAVLLGATALMYNYFNKNSFSKQNIAAKKQETAIADSAIQQNKQLPVTTQFDTANKPGMTVNKKSAKKIIAGSEERKVASVKKENKTDKNASSDIVFDKKEIKQKKYDPVSQMDSAKINTDSSLNTAVPAYNTTVSPVTNALQGKVAGLNIQNDKLLYNNSFQGKVVDVNMQPVIGANVLLENKKIGATTDNNGFFNINTNKNDSVINVYVNSIGFNNTSAILKNNNDLTKNTIQLQPNSNALSEVVVTALGIQKKQDNEDEETTIAPGEPSEKKSTAQKAMPSIGWEQYNNYLDSNKKITTADSTIKGKEIISFIINKKGEVSSFKIIQSLSSAHDTESIRLVKEGPAWKLLKGKKTRATLVIQF